VTSGTGPELGTLERIQRLMLAIATGGLATAWALFGWRTELGLALGSSIAYLNFRWLKKAVFAIAERTVQSRVPASSSGIVMRFLFRYLLMALAAFVILLVSRESLYGFFVGLSLPVSAMLCEAVYLTFKIVIDR
jgi:hypothetical protein